MERNSPQPLVLFYCYARKDRALRDELDIHLSGLRRSGLITTWYDGAISPGASWEQDIATHLNTAHIIILLVSPDFIDSDYCYSKEMKRAIDRHQAGEARVIPVLLRPTDWHDAPFNSLQILPSDAEFITLWSNKDAAFTNVAQGIRRVVDDLLSQSSVAFNVPVSAPPERQLLSIAPDTLQQREMKEFSDKASPDDFLKWLKKTDARPLTYKGQTCQGIVKIKYVDKVAPTDAKQFPGIIIAGESIECHFVLPEEETFYSYLAIANDSVAENICEAANEKGLVEVTLECLGLLDHLNRGTMYHSIYLIRSVKLLKK